MPFKNDFTDSRIPSKDELDTIIAQCNDELKIIKQANVDRVVLEKVDRLVFDLNTIYMGVNTDFAKEREKIKKSLEFIQMRISGLQRVKK